MLKKFCVASIILLIIILIVKAFYSGVKASDLPVKSESIVYASNPPSPSVIEKNIKDLRKEIGTLENLTARKVYDYLSIQKKEITDKNLLEIYYTVLSFRPYQYRLHNQ